MKKKSTFSTLFRWVFPVLHGHLAYLLVLLFFDNIDQIGSLFFRQEVLMLIVMSYCFTESFLWIVRRLDQRFQETGDLVRRLVVQAVLSFTMVILVVYVITYLYFIYIIQFSVFGTELLIFISIYSLSCVLMNLYSFGHIYLNTQNTSLMQEETQRRVSLGFQMQAFQNQVNPPFFYQSLESLILISREGGQLVDDFVGRLSAVYRYKLDNQQSEIAPITEEANLAENTLYVLNQHLNHQVSLKWHFNHQQHHGYLITGSLGDLMQYVLHSSIWAVHQTLHMEMHLSEDGKFLECIYPAKERIFMGDETIRQWEELLKAYGRLSSLVPSKRMLDDKIIIKIPILILNEEGV